MESKTKSIIFLVFFLVLLLLTFNIYKNYEKSNIISLDDVYVATDDTDIRDNADKIILHYGASTRWLERCSTGIFQIEIVDELILRNCYAFKSKYFDDKDTYNLYVINKSFKYAGMSNYGIWKELHPDMECEIIIPRQGYNELPLFCLKDKSACLIVEDRICSLINLTKE